MDFFSECKVLVHRCISQCICFYFVYSLYVSSTESLIIINIDIITLHLHRVYRCLSLQYSFLSFLLSNGYQYVKSDHLTIHTLHQPPVPTRCPTRTSLPLLRSDRDWSATLCEAQTKRPMWQLSSEFSNRNHPIPSHGVFGRFCWAGDVCFWAGKKMQLDFRAETWERFMYLWKPLKRGEFPI